MAVPLKKAESNEPAAGARASVARHASGAVAGIAADRLARPADSTGAGVVALQDASDHSGAAATAPLSAWRYRAVALRHYRAVFRFAAAMLRVDADAEDVTQDTFIRYWQQGQSVQRPREWLFRVARNLCLDRLRRAGRSVSLELDPESEPTDERGPAWHYARDELGARLARLVDTLPEPQRSLVVLFDMQGMSGEECARVIGLNSNQVKVYLHRARKRLRVKLEES